MLDRLHRWFLRRFHTPTHEDYRRAAKTRLFARMYGAGGLHPLAEYPGGGVIDEPWDDPDECAHTFHVTERWCLKCGVRENRLDPVTGRFTAFDRALRDAMRKEQR